MRWFQKTVAAATLLVLAPTAMAGNILRRAPSSAAAAGSSDAVAAAAAAAQADATARQAQSPLRRALDAMKGFQAAQDAARAAASAGPSSVPNGLTPGGLEVSTGTAAVWEGAGLPWWQTTQDGRTVVTVSQNQSKAILTWNTFNVGRETDLHFDQSAGGDTANTWIALNRVTDPNQRPSQILGSIKAQGQVYVINRNGIIFGGTSQVNVATLVASGLDINGGDVRFNSGLLGDASKSAFVGYTLPSGEVKAGPVTVEPGAKVAVASYGQALLLGGEVRNGGSIEAPDGQVVLAAGVEVFLARSTDQRRYEADVNRGAVDNTVQNAREGIISTPRGNITMKGSVIEQDGLLTATTSAEANGSITLGTHFYSNTFGSVLAKQRMTIQFGEGSLTQILPDEGGKKLVGTTNFTPSSIFAEADKIYLRDGSTLYVPGGDVTLSATLNKNKEVAPDGTLVFHDDTRVYLGAGARIDVSGLRDVEVPMEQNTIKAELRANELSDNPVLRSGPLRGRTVYFDARLGGKLRDGSGVADLSGSYDLVERDVKQLMTSGGRLNMSANEIITHQGSVIDLSGGSLRYLDGYVRSTQLIDPTGKRVRIEDAVAGVPYVGIDGDFVVAHSRWGVSEAYSSGLSRARPRFERGYLEGRSAGTLTLSTNGPVWFDAEIDPTQPHVDPAATGAFRIFDGEIRADTVVGPNQRERPTGSTDPTLAWRERPSGATLVIQRSGDVIVKDTGPQLEAGFGFDSPLGDSDSRRYQYVLPARWFNGTTFSSVSIASGRTDDGSTLNTNPRNLAPGGKLTIDVGAEIDLGDYGSFAFSGKWAEIDGAIRAPGGSVSVTTLDLAYNRQNIKGEDLPTTRLGATGVIDVAGLLSNDHLDGAGPMRPKDGGKVSLTGSNVILEQGALVDVGGGARLDAAGTKLTAGNGGSITIDVSQFSKPGTSNGGQWLLRGTLRGHAAGTGKGGTLSLITGDDIVIGDALPANAGSGLLSPQFFTQGGFSGYAVVGERGVTLAAGTELRPSVETLELPDQIWGLPSGTHLFEVAARTVLAESQRAPMSLELSTVPRRSITNGDTIKQTDVKVMSGSSIVMDPGSTMKLSATNSVSVDGTIEARGGSIDLAGVDLTSTAKGSSVHLGTHAQLLAPGYQQSTLDKAQVRRSVQPGGSITLSADDVSVDDGALVDVSGIQGVADLTSAAARPVGGARYEARQVDGDAGTISISALSGLLAGTLRLAPGGEAGAGGTLAIRGKQGLVVRQHASAGVGPTLTVVADSVNVEASGVDDLVLSTITDGAPSFQDTDALVFDGEVSLHTTRSMTLLSPLIRTDLAAGPEGRLKQVSLTSSYVAIKGGTGVALDPPPEVHADHLNAELTVRADLIDLRNAVWLGCRTTGCTGGGFQTARFISSGDVRLSDEGLKGDTVGLFSPGALEFDSAQVYVTSRLQSFSTPSTVPLERDARDPGFLVQSATSITVTSNGSPAPVPLSFGERLTLRAPVIAQGGVVRAPQGQIRLEGSKSVTLSPGSLTSASLEGLDVPFGAVTTTGGFRGYELPGWAPSKSVLLDAPAVAVEKGAVVDVSGGGDLLGYRFSSGDGGSSDVLSKPNTYAVLPSLRSGSAPVGGVDALRDSSLEVGDAIWLHGVPGLADGYYTLLPAHYALSPGGLLVRRLGGSMASPAATFTRPDGTVVASGYRNVSGTSIGDPLKGGPGWGRFEVMSQDVFGKHSQFVTYSFDDSARGLAADASAAVRTPNDAGTVVLNASDSLVLQGTGRFGAGAGVLLGDLDISARKIAVVSGGAAAGSGYLPLDAQALTDFGAGSVLLGGTRAPAATGTAVAVNATDVVVDTRGTSWTGPEIILAAANSVSVSDSSVLRAEGAVPGDTSPLILTGDSALLRLSTSHRVGIVRSGTTGSAGVVSIGNATLSADGSLALDGSQAVALASGVGLSAPQLDLASTRVNLGDVPRGGSVAGTALGRELITRLASSSDLLIRGYDSIHLYGDLSLGSRVSGAASLPGITFDTGLLQGEGGTAQITAGQLALRNGGTAFNGTPASGAGSLVLDVDELRLGPGQVQLAGFGALSGRAGTIEVQATGGLSIAGSIGSAAGPLATGQVRAASGADYVLAATGGDVTLSHDPGTVRPAEAMGLGSRLSIQASNGVSIDTSVVLSAGTFQATAANGALSLGQHASVDVSGRAVDFQDQVRFAPGGAVRLTASGDLLIAGGAVLDVSASTRGGDAGRIELGAGEKATATVQGNLRGAAVTGYRGGSFALDAGAATDFSTLNTKVEGGGFTTSREIRLRGSGPDASIALGTLDTITAHEVVLRSDNGSVTVAGLIDAAGTASHPDGGRIQLFGNDVLVRGKLDARAGAAQQGGFDPSSGKVEIAASGGTVDVAAGAVIDVTGGIDASGKQLEGGSVVVRAPRGFNGNPKDVAVKELAGDLRGAREVLIQGVQDYKASVVNAAQSQTMLGDAFTWLRDGTTTIRARIAGSNQALSNLVQVGAGMVVTSDTNLTIQDDVDLHGQLGPGYFGLAAKGSININAVVSDGFDKSDRTTAALSGSRSSSYGFEAGGDVTIAANSMVRTGTGDISIRSRGNLTLGGPMSVIYTAGMKTATVNGFLGAPAGAPIGEFPTEGGDISIRAGGDIVAPLSAQTTSAWLFRYGATNWQGDATSSTVARQTSWSVVFKNFEQGVGALGGGDVRVSAGRDVVQLQVAIPTTGHLTTLATQVAKEGDLVVRGGGDLELSAGRDIRGGLFMLGRGHADLRAGGSVVASDSAIQLRGSWLSGALGESPRRVGALFGLMDATASVTAASTIDIEGAFDPMRQGQIVENLLNGTLGSGFWGYTERTAFEATSLAGSVSYENDPWASADLSRSGKTAYQVTMSGNGRGSLNEMFSRAPPTLRFTSLEASVSLKDPFGVAGALTMTMAPAAQGTLELLAKEDIRLSSITMEDIDPKYRPGPVRAFSTTGDNSDLASALLASQSNNYLRGSAPIHAEDPDPVRIYALEGSVCADRSGACSRTTTVNLKNATVVLPKPIEVFAGKDILAGYYKPQNNGPDDLSWLRAGRDVFDVAFLVAGEGAAVLEAGRDVVQDVKVVANTTINTVLRFPDGGLVAGRGDDSAQPGQASPGQQPNQALSHDRAADVTIMAGTAGGVGYAAFSSAYLDPENRQGVVRTYLPELRDYMSGLDSSKYGPISNADLVAAFTALPLARRQIFLDRVYFTELKAAGIDYNDSASPRFHSYDRGFRVVSLLFPADPSTLSAAQRGDVILSAKPVETWAKGDITILAPYGRVTVGTELGDTSKAGGIVTWRGGDIRIMADQDIDLFTSRVFTLQGGDITMWTTDGSITAGSGSKTSVFNAPLTYLMSNDAVVTVNAFGIQTGAGIGVLDALQNVSDRPPSRLDLIAPRGEVNAGDAGIRVFGNLNIAAQVVVGMENIQATGASAGVPKVATPNVGALTTASQMAQAASKEGVGPQAVQARSAVADLPSIITVEVVGYETTEKDEDAGDGRRKKSSPAPR